MSVHAHDVLHLLAASDKPLSRDEILAEVEKTAGEDPRFHTCSAQDLTLDQLLEFFLAMGKAGQIDGRYTMDPANMCQH